MSERAGIFAGVRVVELASGIAGPYATMFLADHGADVVKVEAPGGDPYRGQPGFETINRNKRSVILDDPTALLRSASVIVADQPGQLERLRGLNPTAVIVSVAPWGEHGPKVADPASPDLVAAATGVYWDQQSYQDAPVQLVVPVVGYGTAILAALAIAAGLYARQRHGAAPTYEVSHVAGSAAIQVQHFRVDGAVEERDGASPMGSKGRVPIYRLFEASDGEWFFLACGTARFYERLLGVIGREDLAADPRLANPPWGLMTHEAIEVIAPILEDVFATATRDEWLRRLAAADVPAQPVLTRAEFLETSIAAANHLETSLQHPTLGEVAMMDVPLVCEAAPGAVRAPAPALGQHTNEILAELRRAAASPSPASPTGGAGAAVGTPPLEGVSVVDVSSFIAGPLVGRHLAMLGADVVKVEPPTGDPFRAFGPAFATWNQGKRSIALDLTGDDGRAMLHRLVAGADVVVENFRPGVAARLGADAETLIAVNPELIHLSSTGYGSDASMAAAPAFDPLVQALGGIMSAQGGGPGHEPVFLTVAVHDVLTPLISAFGIVAALYHRASTGEAQRVRTSLAQTTMAAQVAEYTRYAGAPDPPLGGWDYAGPADDQGCVETAPGEWAFVEGGERVPIFRGSIVDTPLAQENGLVVEHDHPAFGRLAAAGQLVVGAGPPPARGPLLDEHGDVLRAELGVSAARAASAGAATLDGAPRAGRR